jgi:glycosyltransferase involved in cell wall biosynthesis
MTHSRAGGPPTRGLVSVVIPAFNCASTIEAAVRSCLNQTIGSIEVVVVNDGSTDATRDVLARFGREIRVIDQENSGLAAARSAGQRETLGEFVAWMDGDDLARPERFQVQLAALRAIPGADLVCSDFSAFYDTGEDFEPSHIEAYYGTLRRIGGVVAVFPEEGLMDIEGREQALKVRWGRVYDAMLAGNIVHPPTVLLRRSLLERVGDFDRMLRFSSDYDFLLRASRSTIFAYVELPLLRYRRHGQQMSHAARLGKLQLETLQILEKAQREDAALVSRRGDDLRRLSAEALLSAAYALARTDRTEGLRLLRAAQSHRFLPIASVRALARLAVPNAAIDAVKWIRERLWAATASPVLIEGVEYEGTFAFARSALTLFST